MRHRKYPFIAGFLVVPLTLYVVFVLYPYTRAFYISMTAWRGFDVAPKWIGFKNYERLWSNDDRFWQAVQHHGILLVTLPVITIVIALFFAFLLSVGGKSKSGDMAGVWGSKFYRVVFFLPQVLAVPIIAVLFQTVYRPNESGLINGVLMKLGFDPVFFMIKPHLALPSIIAVLVWVSVGFYVVLFTAGMGSIPQELYEAAELDGAGKFRLFFGVTLPLLRDTLQVAWVYLGIAAFDAFAIVNVLALSEGGPNGTTTVMAVEIFRAYGKNNFGYASALGVALFFMSITFAALTLRVTRREAIEY
ncbi:MAG: sugar ABC transporter permease [Mycobacteriales bacterium]